MDAATALTVSSSTPPAEIKSGEVVVFETYRDLTWKLIRATLDFAAQNSNFEYAAELYGEKPLAFNGKQWDRLLDFAKELHLKEGRGLGNDEYFYLAHKFCRLSHPDGIVPHIDTSGVQVVGDARPPEKFHKMVSTILAAQSDFYYQATLRYLEMPEAEQRKVDEYYEYTSAILDRAVGIANELFRAGAEARQNFGRLLPWERVDILPETV